ncbi:hypothetical protein J31TS4_36150 [Paenibacillus sp. J31TS4]|uniref:hypothetical protein n=1 Tax=Paenibacillus sp. J31TS4 TaxID=2807195 RepID=UPI001B1FF456|nr:hypothetical protein [Paenibacillus sp. J31TS4]GIP40335.1 hypothetical protein J31TS4_36150 [Paenibacillus sp. J31TS4]
MKRLEYRRYADREPFPVLYYYDPIDQLEIALRGTCDYFVKEGIVYETTSFAAEADTYVLYVREAEEERALNTEPVHKPDWRGIRIEVREYLEGTDRYPVLQYLHYETKEEALLRLFSDFLYFEGKEWEKTSAEVDEDRKVYVYYVKEANPGYGS